VKDRIQQTMSSLRFEERAPFFEDAVMAKLDERPRRARPLLAGAVVGVAAFTALSFAVPGLSPLYVTAHSKPDFAINQADVFNFALTGQLPVDEKRAHFVKLTPHGDVVAVDEDSPRVRYHTLEGFYAMLNADLSAMNRFDSLLRTYAVQLSSKDMKRDAQGLSAMLFGINSRLTGEMMELTSGEFPLLLADTMALVFRSSLRHRLTRSEDSLIAAATDSIAIQDVVPAAESRPLTDRPSLPLRTVELTPYNDSLNAVRRV
jgi:hypothetical protein